MVRYRHGPRARDRAIPRRVDGGFHVRARHRGSRPRALAIHRQRAVQPGDPTARARRGAVVHDRAVRARPGRRSTHRRPSRLERHPRVRRRALARGHALDRRLGPVVPSGHRHADGNREHRLREGERVEAHVRPGGDLRLTRVTARRGHSAGAGAAPGRTAARAIRAGGMAPAPPVAARHPVAHPARLGPEGTVVPRAHGGAVAHRGQGNRSRLRPAVARRDSGRALHRPRRGGRAALAAGPARRERAHAAGTGRREDRGRLRRDTGPDVHLYPGRRLRHFDRDVARARPRPHRCWGRRARLRQPRGRERAGLGPPLGDRHRARRGSRAPAGGPRDAVLPAGERGLGHVDGHPPDGTLERRLLRPHLLGLRHLDVPGAAS